MSHHSRWASSWIPLVALLVFVILLTAAWKWTPLSKWIEPDRVRDVIEPHRSQWYTPLFVVGVFVVSELVMFPVLVLVFVCGLVFGPWYGTLYALVGSVASALPPFALGRWLGREKMERWGGALVRKLGRALDRRGIVAVFVVRKIPAPYTLVNLICGASGLKLRDFVLGTLLGMSTGIVLITVVSGQLREVLSDPKPGPIVLGIVLLLIPVTLALLVQRWINSRFEGAR